MKYLLVGLVVVLALWWLGRGRVPPPDRGPAKGRAGRAPQAMLRCAHCGLHLPAADAVLADAHVYCSDAHRLAGPRDVGRTG